MRQYLLYFIAAFALFSSCKQDAYDVGESDLSSLHADFTDITIKDGIAVNAITDDDCTLPLSPSTTYSEKKDTIIRRLLYYTMPSSATSITISKSKSVAVLTPHDTTEVKTMLTDPVRFTSAWLSHNKKYVNMQLGIMVGNNSDESAKQTLTFSCDSVTPSGKTMYVTLRHDQAGYEQYYTEDVYLSIPINAIQSDTLNITVNTYTGKQIRQFVK